MAEILGELVECQFVVVNATDFSDLEIVVMGLQQAQDAGKSFLFRSGPSFVRALAGIEPIGPLTAKQIRPPGCPAGHGLAVVGSHVGQTARQIAAVERRGGVLKVELRVADLVDDESRNTHVADTVEQVVAALADSDVLLHTSRTLLRGNNPEKSLEIARTVSTALTEVVRGALSARPSWVIAKGGITSHDVAVRGLGIRRGTIIGQLFPGMVSVLRPDEATEEARGMPYIIFAGNVGDEDALTNTIEMVQGR